MSRASDCRFCESFPCGCPTFEVCGTCNRCPCVCEITTTWYRGEPIIDYGFEAREARTDILHFHYCYCGALGLGDWGRPRVAHEPFCRWHPGYQQKRMSLKPDDIRFECASWVGYPGPEVLVYR